MMNQLSDRMAGEVPPPCDFGGGCVKRAMCSERRLACQAFGVYVVRGRMISPYIGVEWTHGRDGPPKAKLIDIDEPMPTRGIYERPESVTTYSVLKP